MNSAYKSWLDPRRALAAYTVVFSIFIVWVSLRTAINPLPHSLAIRCLAFAEIGGALLFALRRTRFIGLAILLVIFAIAATIELHLREWPLRFVFYSASVLFVQYLSVQPDRDC
jgi:hypothetical protein